LTTDSYETARKKNIKRNKKMLRELELANGAENILGIVSKAKSLPVCLLLHL